MNNLMEKVKHFFAAAASITALLYATGYMVEYAHTRLLGILMVEPLQPYFLIAGGTFFLKTLYTIYLTFVSHFYYFIPFAIFTILILRYEAHAHQRNLSRLPVIYIAATVILLFAFLFYVIPIFTSTYAITDLLLVDNEQDFTYDYNNIGNVISKFKNRILAGGIKNKQKFINFYVLLILSTLTSTVLLYSMIRQWKRGKKKDSQCATLSTIKLPSYINTAVTSQKQTAPRTILAKFMHKIPTRLFFGLLLILLMISVMVQIISIPINYGILIKSNFYPEVRLKVRNEKSSKLTDYYGSEKKRKTWLLRENPNELLLYSIFPKGESGRKVDKMFTIKKQQVENIEIERISFVLPGLEDLFLEPVGQISPGTTLSIRITLGGGKREINLEIVKDENYNGRVDSEEQTMLNTLVTDCDMDGKVKDLNREIGVVDLEIRLSVDFEPGKYLVRVISGPERYAKSTAIEIPESIELPSMIKEYCSGFNETINTPPPHYIISKNFGFFSNKSDNSFFNKKKLAVHPVYSIVNERYEEGQKKNKIMELWLLDMRSSDSKALACLTNTGDCSDPSWSPDGKQIVYIRQRKNKRELWRLNIKTDGKISKNTMLIADDEGYITNPVWSQSAKQIAFIHRGTLRIIKTDGTQMKQITTIDGIARILSWSRDDRSILIAAFPPKDSPILNKDGELHTLIDLKKPEDKKVFDVLKVDAMSGKKERVIYSSSWLWLPYLSPAGDRLVFHVNEPIGGDDLFLREGNGFNVSKPLTGGKDPTWSPDGKWIVFVAPRSENRILNQSENRNEK